MFRRKEEENAIAEAENPESAEAKNTAPQAGATATAPAASPRTPETRVSPMSQPASPYRPATAPAAPRHGGFAASPAGAPSAAGQHDEKGKRRILTVGNDILLKGEIATCDRLVIEGAVDAKLNDVHTVEIAETGSFRGSAEIQDAEISGLFEGELVVRNRLIIYSTGKVRGKITYGEIEIERGGELTGEIKIAGAEGANKSKEDKDKTKAA